MKTSLQKIILNSTVAACIMTTAIACNGSDSGNRTEDPKDVAEEHNDAKFSKAKEKDAQFLVDVAEINMKEIRLCEMADTLAQAADIKELAKMLKEDHTKCLKEVEVLAGKKMITLPGELTQNGKDATKMVSDKKGKNFDQQFSSLMVDIHKDAIDKFEKLSNNGEDYEIKSWANKKITELRTNLDRSMVCRDKYKDAKENNKEIKK